MSDAIGNAFTVRSNADYADFFIILKEEVKSQLDQAFKFVKEAEQYIKSQVNADAFDSDR